MTSDTFKLYLRRLVKYGYMAKAADGTYVLTNAGKEFANRMDGQLRTTRHQPKLSVMLVVTRPGADDGAGEYLFGQRLRNPFWGRWGFVSGPILWGESPEEAAARELRKQTGLRAAGRVAGFLRKQDYTEQDERLLEDKQFVIVEVANCADTPANDWTGGKSQWMSVAALTATNDYFPETMSVISMLDAGEAYRLYRDFHAPNTY